VKRDEAGVTDDMIQWAARLFEKDWIQCRFLVSLNLYDSTSTPRILFHEAVQLLE
jgi:hypothetical protein